MKSFPIPEHQKATLGTNNANAERLLFENNGDFFRKSNR